ncbi:MAG: methyltransferase domain-containing protein [Methyloprofundus sp.]|nr:methyltransferase domain-containing protein [Methyloprofundus sp.]
MKLDFYQAFENKLQTERENNKARLEMYLPFLQVLQGMYPGAGVIDLGCGHGEWLELLKENNFSAQGVDIDVDMFNICQSKQLNVEQADAISSLQALADGSQLLVSVFHLVENMPFAEVQILVEEALRVLKPAGLLIMETLKPQDSQLNIHLAADTSQSIPAELLTFLPEYYGFEKVQTQYLQEPSLLYDERLSSLSGEAKQNYVVLAQKEVQQPLLGLSHTEFEQQYGISLGKMEWAEPQLKESFLQAELKNLQKELKDKEAELLEYKILSAKQTIESDLLQQDFSKKNKNLQKNSKKIGKQAIVIGTLQLEVVAAKSKTKELKLKIDELHVSNHEWYSKADKLDEELKWVYASKSWLIMQGLLKILNFFRYLVRQPMRLVLSMLVATMDFIIEKPYLKKLFLSILVKFPRLKSYFNMIALKAGLSTKVTSDTDVFSFTAKGKHRAKQEELVLSPSAQHIYADLKQAIKNKGE